MSIDAVHKRILEMSSNIEKNICSNEFQYSYFALQIDERIDDPNNVQLLPFIRFIDEDQIANQVPFFAMN